VPPPSRARQGARRVGGGEAKAMSPRCPSEGKSQFQKPIALLISALSIQTTMPNAFKMAAWFANGNGAIRLEPLSGTLPCNTACLSYFQFGYSTWVFSMGVAQCTNRPGYSICLAVACCRPSLGFASRAQRLSDPGVCDSARGAVESPHVRAGFPFKEAVQLLASTAHLHQEAQHR